MREKYLFVGNRFNVLEEMLKSGLEISHILAIKGSYLERVLIQTNMEYKCIGSKSELISVLNECEFDTFISNGLPYILPSEILKNKTRRFINVHPSFLPDLRGADPVPGAILYERDSGATCHFINEKIDEGDIISQVKLPFDAKWDAVVLYQLSFWAEKKAFNLALRSNFNAQQKQQISGNDIYYTFKQEDLIIDWKDSPQKTVQRIKAFNTPSKGAFFYHNENRLIVRNASLLEDQLSLPVSEGQVIFCVGNSIGIKVEDQLLFLSEIEGDLTNITPNTILY